MSARQVKSLVMPEHGYRHREHRSTRGRELGSLKSRVDKTGKIYLMLLEERRQRRIFAATKSLLVNNSFPTPYALGNIISVYYEMSCV